jgi:uncharacterized membrane protein (DUF485 family)
VPDTSSPERADVRGLTALQRRRVRLTTWVVSLIAAAFYVGFIVMTVMRAHR